MNIDMLAIKRRLTVVNGIGNDGGEETVGVADDEKPMDSKCLKLYSLLLEVVPHSLRRPNVEAILALSTRGDISPCEVSGKYGIHFGIRIINSAAVTNQDSAFCR